jgi:hypothetical protein
MCCQDVNETRRTANVIARLPAILRHGASGEEDDDLRDLGDFRAPDIKGVTAFVGNSDLIVLAKEPQRIANLTGRLVEKDLAKKRVRRLSRL